MLKKELKAIEIGKIWMKKSLDDTHDANHCAEVEKHALNILPYFLKFDPTLDENLVKLAVWWHDSYKARVKKQTFKSVFHEGPISEKIFLKEVGHLVSQERAKRIGKAIKYHANPMYFILKKKSIDSLLNLLVEADQIEGFNIERNKRFLKKSGNFLEYIIGYIQCKMVPLYLFLISKSEYSKKFLKLKTI